MMSQALWGGLRVQQTDIHLWTNGLTFLAAATTQTVPLRGAWSPKTRAMLAFMQLNFLSAEKLTNSHAAQRVAAS